MRRNFIKFNSVIIRFFFSEILINLHQGVRSDVTQSRAIMKILYKTPTPTTGTQKLGKAAENARKSSKRHGKIKKNNEQRQNEDKYTEL